MTAFFVSLLLLMEDLSASYASTERWEQKIFLFSFFASVLIWQALNPRTLLAFQGESSQKIDADVSCKPLVFTIIMGFKYLEKRFDLWGMAALAAQKFIHPQEHIYQLKWVSKDNSLELIYRYTSRHRDTSFNDLILLGQEHFYYCSQERDIFILFVRREALLCMHLASGIEFPDIIVKSTWFLQQRQHWENYVLRWSWLESINAFAAVTQGLSQSVQHRCSEWPHDSSTALLCPEAEAAALGCSCLPALGQAAQLHLQGDKGACRTACTAFISNTLEETLEKVQKCFIWIYLGFSRSQGSQANKAVAGAVHQLTRQSHSQSRSMSNAHAQQGWWWHDRR